MLPKTEEAKCERAREIPGYLQHEQCEIYSIR